MSFIVMCKSVDMGLKNVCSLGCLLVAEEMSAGLVWGFGFGAHHFRKRSIHSLVVSKFSYSLSSAASTKLSIRGPRRMVPLGVSDNF